MLRLLHAPKRGPAPAQRERVVDFAKLGSAAQRFHVKGRALAEATSF